MTIKITVFESELSDGSLTYHVNIGNLRLECITEQDAVTLAEKLLDAIFDHTNETVIRDDTRRMDVA